MKVIFLEDVRGVGRRNEIKEVSAGYVRNFLLPNRLAVVATPQEIRNREKQKQEQEKQEKETVEHLKNIAEKIRHSTIVLEVKADNHGKIFGSVSKDTILEGMRSAGLITKERVEIKLNHPLKEVGEYQVDIDLKKGVETSLKLTLRTQA